MRAELLQLAADLAKRREPFVLAMVVRREPYSSAHVGDMAILTADGAYHGWLGGNCTRPTVRREAKLALADGKPRLVSLSPDPKAQERPGVTALPMTCHSGGSVDIYLEPMLPPPQLLIFGESPCARALVRLGEVMGYGIVALPEPSALPASRIDDAYAVVATMGENDEDCIAAALAARCGYVAVVASRTRFAEIRESLLRRGIAAAVIDQVHNPAGLDLGARVPEEVALSILAEIVQVRRAAERARPAPVETEATEIDPVCGMTVVIATARHKTTHAGHEYFFCNPRCREKFLADPVRFLAA
jgi:xanthine dehydrogenase accessory factor